MNLVVGATGALGGELCRMLVENGRPVRALVPPGSDAAAVERLRALGVELSEGDLGDRESLDRACAGASVVVAAVDTLSAVLPAEAKEEHDQAKLIAAARDANVGRYVLTSLTELPVRFPLQDTVRAAEQMLAGTIPHTILRAANLMELWLSPPGGWDVANGRVSALGPGDRPGNWVSLRDVAQAAVASLGRGAAGAALDVSGEYASPNGILAAVEEATGEPLEVQRVPVEQLQAEKESAVDPVQETIAGFRLGVALGDPVDRTAALRELVDHPMSARAFVLERATHGC